MSDDGKRHRRKLSNDEHALWRHVIRSVLPLKRRLRAAERAEAEPAEPVPKSSSKPAPARRAAPTASRHAPPAPKPAPALAPLDRREKQRLARGRAAIDARIDLHGRTQSEAHDALLHFLRCAQGDGAKFVLVITGKGARADEFGERGVLKRQVPHWLQLPEFRAYVVGFEDAHVGHGGGGALYVRLRRARLGR
jgi:DNA-nicking Smr family endonuclease